jgi:hypothetical protein
MRHFKILIVLIFSTEFLFAQLQVTISLITDTGVKNTEYLHFSISNATSTTHNFTFDKFSKDGRYSNTNLFQYIEDVDTGLHKMNITLKTDKEQNITDTLIIDHTTSRVGIFVFISTTDSTGDFIKEIKTLKYQTNSNYVKFSLLGKPEIGSDAGFNIENIGDKEIYGYPNNAFFFGTLYEEIGNDTWTQHYPLYINIKYCDTISQAKPLPVGQSTQTWAPNDKDCSKYKFVKKGNYYFELLYSTINSSNSVFQGLTKLDKVDIYRQIFEFKL